MNIQELIQQTIGKRMLVVGDVALDINNVGEYIGISSREVHGKPVFFGDETTNPGAAGNLAMNLAKLGAQVTLICGFTTKDMYGMELLSQLLSAEIDVVQIETDRTKKYGKNLLPNGNLEFRSDTKFPEITDSMSNEITEHIQVNSILANGLIYADYAEEHHIGIVSIFNMVSYPVGLDIFITSRNHMKHFRSYEHIWKVGNTDEITDHSQEYIVVTDGQNSVKVNTKYQLPAISTKPAPYPNDPCGAGDTFLAIFSLCISSGIDVEESVKLGMSGARWTCMQMFTTGTPTWDQVIEQYDEIYGRKGIGVFMAEESGRG